MPGRLERVVGAEAAGLLEDPLDGVRAAGPGVGRALAARQLEPVVGQVDADDPLRPLQPRRPRRPRARPCRRRTRRRSSPASTLAVYIAAPSPVASPHANSAQRSSGASSGTLASAISGITVYSANVLVPMKWRIGSPSRLRRVVPSGRWPRFCSVADRHAQVGARATAVHALAALRREQRHHVVADREVVDAFAELLDHARALVAEHGGRVAGRIGARRRVHVGVTDAAGHEPHEHLARLRLREVDLLHRERRPNSSSTAARIFILGRPPAVNVLAPAITSPSRRNIRAMWILFDLNGTLLDPADAAGPEEIPVAALDEANVMAMITSIAGRRRRSSRCWTRRCGAVCCAPGARRTRRRSAGATAGHARLSGRSRRVAAPARRRLPARGPDASPPLEAAEEAMTRNAVSREPSTLVFSAPELGAFKPDDLASQAALERPGRPRPGSSPVAGGTLPAQPTRA